MFLPCRSMLLQTAVFLQKAVCSSRPKYYVCSSQTVACYCRPQCSSRRQCAPPDLSTMYVPPRPQLVPIDRSVFFQTAVFSSRRQCVPPGLSMFLPGRSVFLQTALCSSRRQYVLSDLSMFLPDRSVFLQTALCSSRIKYDFIAVIISISVYELPTIFFRHVICIWAQFILLTNSARQYKWLHL